MAPAKTRPTKKIERKKKLTKRATRKRPNQSCYVNTSSSSSSSYSSDDSSTSDSCTSCSDSMCSDCCECETVPYRKRVDRNKNKQNKMPPKATTKGKKKPARRGKYSSSYDSSSCPSSDDCYDCVPKKPGRKARA